jgi:integrase
MTDRLTIKALEKLRRKPGRYLDSDGLFLQVRPTGASWIWRYSVRDGAGRRRQKTIGLGKLRKVQLFENPEEPDPAKRIPTGSETFNLDVARGLRDTYADQLKRGIDPLAARRSQQQADALAAAKATTFEESAREYHRQHESKWKNKKHAAQFLSTLEAYAFPVLGKISIADVDTPLVLKVLDPIWKTKTETANRVRGRIELVLGWATVRGLRTGDNPARWRRHLSEVLPARNKIAATEHHAALPYEAVSAFMAELKAREGVAALALRFLTLTAARTSEVTGMTWGEVDFKNRVWSVPASRMKAKREHRVPLSDAAIEILKAAPRETGNDHAFIGPRARSGLSNAAMAATLKRLNRTDFVVHGLRSTFRDWCAECTSHPNHVIEMALAHTIGDKVEKAYRRGDLFAKRVKLMADWARYATSPPRKAAQDNNVVAMRKGA